MAEIPDGMVVVTREEFFALLKADTRDIMPRHNQPDYTIWETKGREAWGWTVPGWSIIMPDEGKRIYVQILSTEARITPVMQANRALDLNVDLEFRDRSETMDAIRILLDAYACGNDEYEDLSMEEVMRHVATCWQATGDAGTGVRTAQ
jgi:hypothetical protein